MENNPHQLLKDLWKEVEDSRALRIALPIPLADRLFKAAQHPMPVFEVVAEVDDAVHKFEIACSFYDGDEKVREWFRDPSNEKYFTDSEVQITGYCEVGKSEESYFHHVSVIK